MFLHVNQINPPPPSQLQWEQSSCLKVVQLWDTLEHPNQNQLTVCHGSA